MQLWKFYRALQVELDGGVLWVMVDTETNVHVEWRHGEELATIEVPGLAVDSLPEQAAERVAKRLRRAYQRTEGTAHKTIHIDRGD